MEDQTESRKTRLIIFSRSVLARKTEPNIKLYGKTAKVYLQVKFLGITFDSQLTFQKHFEDILDCCNTRYHRVTLLVHQKWGPSPSTVIHIYKQRAQPIFECNSLSIITASDNIISKNSMAPEIIHSACPPLTNLHLFKATSLLLWSSMCKE